MYSQSRRKQSKPSGTCILATNSAQEGAWSKDVVEASYNPGLRGAKGESSIPDSNALLDHAKEALSFSIFGVSAFRLLTSFAVLEPHSHIAMRCGATMAVVKW